MRDGHNYDLNLVDYSSNYMKSSERNFDAKIALGKVVGSEGLELRSSKSLTVSGRAVETLKHNLSRSNEEGSAKESPPEERLL